MTSDPDPFEQGQRAARKNIPAEANPYPDGSEQHSLWAAGHERVAGAIEANESEGAGRCFVIPGRALRANPESRSRRKSLDSGFARQEGAPRNDGSQFLS